MNNAISQICVKLNTVLSRILGCKVSRAALLLVSLSGIHGTASAAELDPVSGTTFNGTTIQWAPLDEAIGYNIFLDFDYIDTVNGVTSFTPQSPGEYRISGFDGKGNFSPLEVFGVNAGLVSNSAMVGTVTEPVLEPVTEPVVEPIVEPEIDPVVEPVIPPTTNIPPTTDNSDSPQNVSGTVYSRTAGEIFWDRNTTRTLNYVVTINGAESGNTNGTSYWISSLRENSLNSVSVASRIGNGALSESITLQFDTRGLSFPTSAVAQSGATVDPVITPVPDNTPDTNTPETSTGLRLVTIADNTAGWYIIGGESQWMSPECRQSIEARGGSFSLVPWSELAATADTSVFRNCDDVSALYFTQEPEEIIVDNARPLQLLRGMNLAGDFEVEPRGAWGRPIEEAAFPRIAAAGFDHVRLPVRWSSYTGAAPSFTINETFFSEVDRMVELANESNLGIIVNIHFFEELDEDPAGERARFLAIWDQIARRYQDQPQSVVFELLNEPVGEFLENPQLWNELAADALAVVRRTNPERAVMIGSVQYNHPSRLPDLVLPSDSNLIATIHSYDPVEFTHQGAEFVDPMPPTGVLWRANAPMIDFDWLDYSWNTTVTATATGLQAAYESQYAAVAIRRIENAQSYRQLVVEADQAFDAFVLCNYLTSTAPVSAPIQFTGNSGVADISGCGEISSLAIQLVDADPVTVTLSRIGLCTAGCDEIIVTQYQALDKQLSTAAAWAANRGVPLYLGEFGTLDPPRQPPTEPRSRADWTRTMRTLAESYGIGWGYFGMDDGFGAYDRDAGRWIPEILDALID